MLQEYIITVFSENKVGLLNQITTVFTCRNVNIESITASESALPGIHKYTIVLRTCPERIELLARQIEKKIDVLKCFVYTPDEVVRQEIALYKVARSRNVERLVREHNVRILEIDAEYIVVEKTGHKAETQALFDLLKPYGVQQFVRSGTVAISKSRQELLSEYDSNAAKFLSNTYVATIVTLIPSYLLCLGGYLNIWPLFGAANQLLSALVLIALAVFLRTTGRKSWMLYIPMTFMFVVTMSALCLSLYGIYGKLMAGTFVLMVDGLQLVVALALMFLALMVVKHCGKELVGDTAKSQTAQ